MEIWKISPRLSCELLGKISIWDNTEGGVWCWNYFCPSAWHKTSTLSITHLRQTSNSYKDLSTEFYQAPVILSLQKFHIFLRNSEKREIMSVLRLQQLSVQLFPRSVKQKKQNTTDLKNQIAATQFHLREGNCFSITVFFSHSGQYWRAEI